MTRYEDLLFKNLFKDYNREIRPVLKESDSVEAQFGFALSEIIDLVRKDAQFVHKITKLYSLKPVPLCETATR